MAPLDRPSPTAVVDQCIDRLLEHALLVADDDVRRLKLQEVPEAVVPVDHPSIEVVQVACGKPSAVQLDHGVQLGGQHRQHGEDHPFELVAALSERFENAEALDRLLAALAGSGSHLLPEVGAEIFNRQPLEYVEDRLGAHAGAEHLSETIAELAEARLGEQVQDFDALEFLDPAVHVLLDLGLQLLELVFDRSNGLRVGIGFLVFPISLRLGLLVRFDFGFCPDLGVFFPRGLGSDLLPVSHGRYLFLFPGVQAGQFRIAELLKARQSSGAGSLIYACDGILREIEDSFQIAGRKVKQQSKAGGCPSGKPDVGDGRREANVPHALPAHLGARDFNTATVTHHAFVADLLVLAAVALPVLGRAEDAFAEKPILLRAQRAVVDSLRLRNLSV